jgi:UDP-3-O-[3-hydroxymyristoyl] N-acetylglucosamine deacetylase
VRLQRTIRKELVFEGQGLHTGRHVVMKLRPAPRDSGIVFFRSDKGAYINANIRSVTDTAFATTIGSNGTKVKTVEHVMAALSGLNIDNIIIDVNGQEVPILDGSSLEFVNSILECGIAKQACNRPYLKVTKPVAFKEGHAEIIALPYDGRLITYQIAYDHRLLGHQKMCVELLEDIFTRELAPARTFGFLKDVEHLKSMGLAKGGSLENAVILSDTGVINTSGLRFKDEFIRHKILDFIGDMSLCGLPILGHFVVCRSGHTTNAKFFRKFLASSECWQIVTEVEEPLTASA